MKRLTSLLLTIIMALSLAACSKQAASRYCANCGHGLAKDVSFCDDCGANVDPDKDESSYADEKISTTATTTSTAKTTDNHSTAKQTTTTPTTTSKKPTTTNTEPTTTAKAHTHSYIKEETPATCTEKGYTTYICSCGYSYKDNFTNPSHSYSKYQCTKCDAIDKTHVYEYLIEWIKVYGTADGSHINFDYYVKGDNYTRYSLSYDASQKYLYLNKGAYYQEEYIYSALRLDDYSSYVSFKNCEVVAYINPAEFTTNSPLTNTRYSGLSSNKWDMIELARLSTMELIEWLEWCLNGYDVGITIKDLGFTAY